MRFEQHYVVRGNDALRAKAVDDDGAEYLAEARHFVNNEGGRSTWTDADHLLKMKLFFIAWMKSESTGNALLDAVVVAEDDFDRWWTIEAVDDVGHVDELADDLEPEAFAGARLPDNALVNAELERLRSGAE